MYEGLQAMRDAVQRLANQVENSNDFLAYVDTLDLDSLLAALRSMDELAQLYPMTLIWPELLLPEEKRFNHHKVSIQTILPLYPTIVMKEPSSWTDYVFPATTRITISPLQSTGLALRFIHLWGARIESLWIGFDAKDDLLDSAKLAIESLPHLRDLRLQLLASDLPRFIANCAPLTLSHLTVEFYIQTYPKYNFSRALVHQFMSWLDSNTIHHIDLINVITTQQLGQELMQSILSHHSINSIRLWKCSLSNSWPTTKLPDRIEALELVFENDDNVKALIEPIAYSRLQKLTIAIDGIPSAKMKKDMISFWVNVFPTLTNLKKLLVNTFRLPTSCFNHLIQMMPQMVSLEFVLNELSHNELSRIVQRLPDCPRLTTLRFIRQPNMTQELKNEIQRLALPSIQYLATE